MLRAQQGSILLEALIAVAIFAFGFLALMGMQAAAIKNATQAKYRNDAALLASQIIGQMSVDPINFAAYGGGAAAGVPAKAQWLADVAAALPNGLGSIVTVDTVASPRTATITITWQAPNETAAHRHVAATRIMTSCYDPATASMTC